MNKRLSMDKGAWQAFQGLPAPDGIQSVADYTHRLHEINEVAGLSKAPSMDPLTLFALSNAFPHPGWPIRNACRPEFS
jgi:hypothetical protein